ncbi:hypothetical protein DSO57_1023216 [Entomophthora muscae]|nr:hypothetical protein DSO57_1023216 [Entomophthora muscae]
MDIEVEIPEPSRKLVRTLFQSWFAFIGIGVINFVSSVLNLASKPAGLESTGTTFGTALLYMLLMPFPSFFFWYRPVYNAFMKERAFFYFVFFVFNGFHILYLIYMTIGIPGTGSCGLINTIIVLADRQVLASIFGFFTVALWAALALLNAYLFLQVHRHCQEAGHSFSDAKNEAMSRAARSGVARDAAGSYVQQQFSA